MCRIPSGAAEKLMILKLSCTDQQGLWVTLDAGKAASLVELLRAVGNNWMQLKEQILVSFLLPKSLIPDHS